MPRRVSAHGLTLTAAFEIAFACDIILAAPKAKFGLVETVVGLTPSMGGPQRLAERAGSGRARELVMTGDLYDAATLHDWGVVNAVHEDVDAEARALVDTPGGRADARTRRHEADHLRVAVGWSRARRLDHTRRVGCPVRDRRPRGCGTQFPRRRTGQGDVPRTVGVGDPLPATVTGVI